MGLLNQIINTFVQKAPDGYEYVRIADIAPHAYDEVKDEYKVSLTGGSTIELIKSHENYEGLISNANAYFGEGIRNSDVQILNPLDVSEFKKRTVVIYNHHDAPLNFRVAMFYIDSERTGRELVRDAINIEIPAYQDSFGIPGFVIIDESVYPDINTALPYIGLDIRQGADVPTTGHLDVYVFGGR